MNLLFKTTFYLPETRLKPTEISKRTKTSNLRKKNYITRKICISLRRYSSLPELYNEKPTKSTSYISLMHGITPYKLVTCHQLL